MDFLAEAEADVVCLQEIKARPEQVAEVDWPEGWQLFWNPARRPGYAGTATLARIPPTSFTSGIGDPSHDGEGRVLTCEFADFYLVNVYVPNAKRELSRLRYRAFEWSPAFLSFLLGLERRKPVIVCGDMNVAHREIDLARPKENVGNAGFTHEERACFEDVLGAGFLDAFREFQDGGGHYTWWSYQSAARERNIGWRIDYFLVSSTLRSRLRNAFIWPHIKGSDHCPVGIDIS